MKLSFAEALKAKAEKIELRTRGKSESISPAASAGALNYDPESVRATIELVAIHNRIDVFFSSVPSEAIRRALKDAGYKFSANRKAWYNYDCECNREVLRELLGAEIEPFDPLPTPQDQEDTVSADVPEYTTEPFEIYKRQIDKLCAELKCDAADLALKAVDCLYRVTFNN